MDRPRILIPTNFRGAVGDTPPQAYLNDAYVRLIADNGGLPVLAPPAEQFDERYAASYEGQGLMLAGGFDLDPALYGQDRHPKSTPLHPRREEAELAWFNWADHVGMPVFGICLGCQLVNVARGGSLIQYLGDTPGLLDHGDGEHDTFHDVAVCGATLAGIVGGDTCSVNSRHVQAVDRLGRDLRAAGRTADGVVEAVEDTTGRFLIAVQWHPEDLGHDPATKAMVGAFIAAAGASEPR